MAFDKNPNSIIAELKLLDTSGTKPFLLVEGAFDYNFWRNKIHLPDVVIVDCKGRDNVEAVISINCEKNIAKALGITDRDYDYFFPTEERPRGLIYTDFNDLETTLLSTGIGSEILQELCDLDSLTRDGISLSTPTTVFRDALFMGKLRLLSKKYNYDFPFEKQYSMGRYYDANHNFCREVLLSDFSLYVNLSYDEIVAQLSFLPDEPLWHLLRGHDCLFNLFQVIQKYKFSKIKSLNLEVQIRCMFHSDRLQMSSVYADIRCWEREQNCQVLACLPAELQTMAHS